MRHRISWEYARPGILTGIFLIAFFWYFILPLFSTDCQETVFSVAILDCRPGSSTQSLGQGFLAYLGLEENEFQVQVDSSCIWNEADSASVIKATILLSSVGQMDAVICGEAVYQRFHEQGAFQQLPGGADFIEISQIKLWQDLALTDDQPAYLCIPVSCPHPQTAAAFIHYLLGETT